jgi:HTH-type transcriptional regulator / antitoxin HigA
LTTMANDPTSVWQPNWAVPPGDILLEALQDRGMTQAELAQRTARPPKTINEIVKGKAAITAETAIQLERALGISARFWTGLEATYRNSIAQQEAQRDLEANTRWIERFPIADLVRHKQIERGSSKADTLRNLLSYLGLSSPVAFDRHWLSSAAAFRSSPAFMASPEAVAAWLTWGEREAAKIDVAPFDAVRFRQVLTQIRPLTRRVPFIQIFDQVKAMCAAAGVVVLLIPELKGTHLSGAARWLGNKAVIQLSLRHRKDDQFWFTFFHEAGHLLSGSRRRDFVDAAEPPVGQESNDNEEAANQFAHDVLLPPIDYQAFVSGGDFSQAAILAFAERQQIAAGLVVAGLQADGLIPRSHSNNLKKTIHFPSDRR